MKTTSLDKAFREMIREEVADQLAPLRTLITRLQASTAGLDRLATSLGPLSSLLGGGGGRGGRRAAVAGATGVARTGRRGRPATLNNRACAIIDCPRPARTKGYCAAHYQKLRSLTKTGRLPADWKDFAPAASVQDVVLPRGRAAAKLKRGGGRKKATT